MKKQINTANAPAAIGPYSQAVIAGGMLYCSGQIPLDPATATIVEGDISVQTAQVFKNIKAVLAAANTDISKVVKTTVFLKNMNDFAKMNAVYETEMGECIFPARSAVEVACLPKGALVEVEVIAEI